MNILMLTPYPPHPPHRGGAIRMVHLLHTLARTHRVTLLTFAPNDAAVAALEALRDRCQVIPVIGPPPRTLIRRAWESLTSLSPDMAFRNQSISYAQTLTQLIQNTPYDVVQVESIEMAGYAIALTAYYRQRNQQRPLLVLDEFNAEYVIQRRAALTDLTALVRGAGKKMKLLLSAPYSLIQWYKLAAYERRMLQLYDHTFAVSEEDRQALHRLVPRARIHIIPNGVDTEYFRPLSVAAPQTAESPPTLVFTGSLDYRPNIDAIHWFVTMVFPLVRRHTPNVRFLIIGRQPVPSLLQLHDGTSIMVVANVPDVRPYLMGARVYVLPMRIGGGVRLKLLESLAMQLPVVCTTMGAEGIPELQHGKHLLLADEPTAFAQAIGQLLDAPQWGRELGEAGRMVVRTHYDWTVIGRKLEHVYACCLEENPQGPVHSNPRMNHGAERE